MPRPTKQSPEKGSARARLLDAARDVIRAQGFAATSVDDLCRAAGVTKGAFFHHFASKDALGVAAARHWQDTTTAFFAAAPYHAAETPLTRIRAYIAFRRSIITDDLTASSCLAGTLVQETHDSSPAIRDACAAAIFGHTATLESDFRTALADRGLATPTPESLARHTQTVLQGAFIMAKAADDVRLAHDALDHLQSYICLLLKEPT